ncbi:MAG: glucose-1-phosphate thymidylyltransferase [Bacteroidales bacterium]|jgi:UDP-N-acetylglucosamine diphosphorylase/glucosamine-1-phosphate N-acetyltransferase|nr:glucose-1-phosphate thymidylyltransferase [Bacteroidales bacterium]
MNLILFDGNYRGNLLPLVFTRPVAELRVGILTLREKWEKILPDALISFLTEPYLSNKYPGAETGNSFYVAGNICASPQFAKEVLSLKVGECLYHAGDLLAVHGSSDDFRQIENLTVRESTAKPLQIKWLYDIFQLNNIVLQHDYRLLTEGRESQPLSPGVQVIGSQTLPDGLPSIFLEDGADVECAALNVKNGPIYIGKDAQVMEGACIRAPFAACEHATVTMGARIYGATTVGPYCKAGGELNNVVMYGFSNKAHDGFLGNAVIGEWCNIGAGATASNLKNDYSKIKLWNYAQERFLPADLQFCGLIMGDHSKIGINSMINTATIMGVGVNFFGAGFPRTFIPSFSKKSVNGFDIHKLTDFFNMADTMMQRRGKSLTDTDKEIFQTIFDITGKYWRVG